MLGLGFGVEQPLEKNGRLPVALALDPNQPRRRPPEPELHPVPVGVVRPQVQDLGSGRRRRPLLQPHDDVTPVLAAVEDELGRRVDREGRRGEQTEDDDGDGAAAAHLSAAAADGGVTLDAVTREAALRFPGEVERRNDDVDVSIPQRRS